ncbi:MAG: hypothetical protein OQK78_10520 [Gammaproteobacteria bacterium]|nr:hypothetical protein [Gammaproteobacteria bacterium]
MYRRHDEVPVYQYRQGAVQSVHYNTVQTAFKRLGDEIRLSIPRLRTLDLILQHDAWIVVDNALGDLPIAAWTEFRSAQRDALHTPVDCQIRLFHANGNLIINHVLEAMELLLGERLNAVETTHSVIHFPEK